MRTTNIEEIISINKKKNPVIWIISDTHFGHRNAIRFCRPRFVFSDEGLDEMNSLMIRNWNDKVGKDDIIIHLGDFSFKMSPAATAALVASLNGKKIIVRGNHDKGSNALYQMGFDFVCEELVVKVKGNKILCIHKPQLNLRPDVVGIFHGHIHNSTKENLVQAGENPAVLDCPFNVNLSVEVIGYKPMRIEEALGLLRLQTKLTAYEKDLK